MTRFPLLASLSLAALLAAGAAQAQDVNFGDNTSRWANDGECDDPRFQNTPNGYGMAEVLLDEDLAHDANDCRALYSAGAIELAQGGGQSGGEICAAVQFGDDSSQWANDGECDDPRFQATPGGYGMAQTLLGEDAMHDANDCRSLCNQGAIQLSTGDPAQAAAFCGSVNFGDDSSEWANDGECDDPRFEAADGGYGMADVLLDEDTARDANDCRALCSLGAIRMAQGGGVQQVDEICGHVQFGDNESRWANDGECDDPRFETAPNGYGMAQTLLGEDAFHDANDCRSLCNQGAIVLRTR